MNNLVLVYSQKDDAVRFLETVFTREGIIPEAVIPFYPDKNGYTIEQIRAVIDLASHRYGSKSAYVLWNFETAKEVVQNSFLKVFEEHSENIKFILAVTSDAPLLMTILSRATVVRLKTVPAELTAEQAEKMDQLVDAVRKGVLASTLVTTTPAKKREDITNFINQFMIYGYHKLGTKTANRQWLNEKLSRALEAYPLVNQNFIDSEAVLDNIFLT